MFFLYIFIYKDKKKYENIHTQFFGLASLYEIFTAQIQMIRQCVNLMHQLYLGSLFQEFVKVFCPCFILLGSSGQGLEPWTWDGTP